ncbi:Vitamin B12 import ATP-binding protein BtuD [Pseudomonas fluorescens]|uniref:Vitamin B12 import ATP-binding protein BtuD n=1 Tax=Pseudomonas fluorescens TaxID=294 RepID=A0A5E6ZLP9_PSEFL|nr:Vitamin B12 import ATP-binding protein BtuD [Pseudomonas fluorescens]
MNQAQNSRLLSVEGLNMHFGGIKAIQNLDFKAASGEITAVIGPNGAGKTTAFNCVTGFYRPTSGKITVEGAGSSIRVDSLSGHQIVTKAGIARTFQNIRLFKGMTALENLLVAQHTVLSGGGLLQVAGLFGLKSYRDKEEEAVAKAMTWLRRMNLVARADDLAGNLSYGQQRRLEIARAMCLDPEFLCLDEPAAGLNPKESGELGEDLQRLKLENGVGVLLIEHDMSVVMNVSDRIVVLEYGKKLAEGTPEYIKEHPGVIAAYLGHSDSSTSLQRLPRDGRVPTTFAPAVLAVENLHVSYGAVEVLHGINMEVRQGEIVTLLGANGAGKSTLLKTIFGSPAVKEGSISFSGTPLKGLQSHCVADLGIAHSPEGRRIMPKMTVLENLQIGAFLSDPKHFQNDLKKVFRLFPRLEERAWQRAGTMSGGEQQMLAIGRALMQRPKLLLLDEPSLGLAPLVIRQIFDAIQKINKEDGITVLLVEQNAAMALAIADRGYVLQTGRIVHSGDAEVLASQSEIRNAYLEGMAVP